MSQIFATKVSRGKLYWTHIILAISMGLIGILISATALGVTALSTMKNSSITMFDFINIGINLFPSLLFFTALAALMLGFIPKLGKLVYVYLIYSFFLNYFKGILNLPQWIEKTSPQSWLSNMPVMDFDVIAFFAMTTMSVAMMVIGYYGYKKRDMVEEA